MDQAEYKSEAKQLNSIEDDLAQQYRGKSIIKHNKLALEDKEKKQQQKNKRRNTVLNPLTSSFEKRKRKREMARSLDKHQGSRFSKRSRALPEL